MPALATVVAVGLLVVVLGWGLRGFRMEATSDSIVLENDADLRFYDDTREVFGSDAELIVAVEPRAGLPGSEGDARTSPDVFQRDTIDRLALLVEELAAADGVESVTSILSVPLFHSPSVGLLAIASHYRTLADPAVDLELARAEMLENPLYVGALVSADATTTLMAVRLQDDEQLMALEAERYALRDLERGGGASAQQRRRLQEVEASYKQQVTSLGDERRSQIAVLRDILQRYEAHFGRIELGGVPMIAVDIVEYVERDIWTFGIAVLVFVLLALALLLRSLKWTILVTLCSTSTVLAMAGLLGWLDWRTTIVTSNLTSLLFIIATAMAVHLVVRYREQHARHPRSSQSERSRAAVLGVWWPTVFTAITTVVGFGSLYVSDIRPVMDFALMMSLGIALAVGMVFVLLPALGLLWPDRGAPAARLAELDESTWLSRMAEVSLRHPKVVAGGSAVVFLLGLAGASRLTVENRFMDYFDEATPIHRGMEFIDRELGGTTPLEVVIDLQEEDAWLDVDALAELREVHEWLAAQPEVGTVTSLDSMVRIVEKILRTDPSPLFQQASVNEGMLRTVRARVPEETARLALGPYINADYSQTRILTRVNESDPDLDRSALLERLDAFLSTTSFAEMARPTGMFVLYNNMLQSLYRSQIKTIVVVFLAIWLTFLALFRSWRVASVALIPNVLPTVVVLGSLGWAGVPLNMMTIMIAAVTLGIAVDDTTHYLHRYRSEHAAAHGAASVLALCSRAHNSVGRAVVTTTLAIAAGFATLTLSNFVPTVQFGLLTGFAMMVALVADLLLLPVLLARFRPFDREPRKLEPRGAG